MDSALSRSASLSHATLRRPASAVEAVCVKYARTDLCGGYSATSIPTATPERGAAGPATSLPGCNCDRFQSFRIGGTRQNSPADAKLYLRAANTRFLSDARP